MSGDLDVLTTDLSAFVYMCRKFYKFGLLFEQFMDYNFSLKYNKY